MTNRRVTYSYYLLPGGAVCTIRVTCGRPGRRTHRRSTPPGSGPIRDMRLPVSGQLQFSAVPLITWAATNLNTMAGRLGHAEGSEASSDLGRLAFCMRGPGRRSASAQCRRRVSSDAGQRRRDSPVARRASSTAAPNPGSIRMTADRVVMAGGEAAVCWDPSGTGQFAVKRLAEVRAI
jgi:hypothetical protein